MGCTENVARYDTDYRLCIICQTETDQKVMVAPTSHEKVLNMIRKRVQCGNENCPETSRRLGEVTYEMLKLRITTWHRKCYQDTVHVGMCKRAKEHYEKKLSTKGSQSTSTYSQ